MASIGNNNLTYVRYNYIYYSFNNLVSLDILIPISLLIFLSFLTQNKQINEIDQVLRKIRKYKKIIIGANEIPKTDKIIKVYNIDDIIKIAINNSKSIILKKNGGLQFWIIDADLSYFYEIKHKNIFYYI